MLNQVPPRDCFDVPAGRYQAVCVEAREFEKFTNHGQKKFLRIVWELQGSPDPDIRYLVAKNYPPSLAQGSPLRNDLRTWFGRNVDVSAFESQTLVNQEASLTVEQIYNPAYEKPFCWVRRVQPPYRDLDGEEDLVP